MGISADHTYIGTNIDWLILINAESDKDNRISFTSRILGGVSITILPYKGSNKRRQTKIPVTTWTLVWLSLCSTHKSPTLIVHIQTILVSRQFLLAYIDYFPMRVYVCVRVWTRVRVISEIRLSDSIQYNFPGATLIPQLLSPNIWKCNDTVHVCVGVPCVTIMYFKNTSNRCLREKKLRTYKFWYTAAVTKSFKLLPT